MRKLPYRFTHITVKEWYTDEGGAIYQWWEFQNGERIKRLTPFNEIPWVDFKPEKEKEA